MPRTKKGFARPSGAPLKLIVASASEADAARWIDCLEQAGHPCEWVRVERRETFADRLASFPRDAVLFDDALPFPAAEALLLLREDDPVTPLVALSGSNETAAEAAAIEAGLSDWVPKADPERLPAALARALRERQLRQDCLRGEEQVHHAEEKLRALLDQSPDVVLVLQGATGTILRANRAAFLLLGRDERELAGKHVSLLLPPDADCGGLLEKLRAGATRAGAGAAGYDNLPLLASHPFRDAAGHAVPMDVTAAPLPWGNTRVLLCTLRDVAARDAGEEARLRAEFALDRAAGPVIWSDAAGRVCGATAAACERLGYPPGGLDGLSRAEVEPGLGPELWALHWDELRHYGAFRMDAALRRRDGTTLGCAAEVSLLSHRGREWRCAVLLDPVPGADGAAPVDPRLALLRHAPDLVARLDARGTVVDVVGAAAAPWDEARGTPFSSRAHPGDAPAVEAALERARREPFRPARVTWRAPLDGAGGGFRVLETLFVNRLADPALRGFLAASRDVTERRLAEEGLFQREDELRRANDELRQAARLKDEFLAGLGHELRTPLNAVLNLAEALRQGDGAQAPLSPRQIASLETIRGGGRHLLALLNDLLDLARIEAGKLALTWEVTDAAAVCRGALELVEEEARRKRIVLSLSDSEPGLAFRADPRRLRQALLNLLANAVAFTPEGGTVRLEVERDAARGAVLFHVVDNGIGIDPADLPRLFRPFVQLPGGGALARRQGGLGLGLRPGSGLGLSLVSRLVRLHGGAVEAQSAPGRGSRFTLLLPDGLPDGGAGDGTDDSGIVVSVPPAARPLLLLAGDDDDRDLADGLAGAGFRVAAARGGLETVEQARALRPDLIVLDARLDERGGLGGPEVIRRLRAAAPAVPIAALAALSVPGDREACLDAGADAYVRRPLPARRLAEILAALLRRESPGAPPAPLPARPADAPAATPS